MTDADQQIPVALKIKRLRLGEEKMNNAQWFLPIADQYRQHSQSGRYVAFAGTKYSTAWKLAHQNGLICRGGAGKWVLDWQKVIDETIQAHDKANMQQPMERIEYTIDQANHQLRALIAHFRVPINARGLAPAIEETIRQTRAAMDIPIYLQNEWRQLNFEPDIELNVLRIVQECMANIRKHSQASSVRVYLGERNAAYVVLIEDDGVGFVETNTMPEGGRHLGLGILRDRAQQIDAKLDIESEPGEGTRVHLEFNQAPLPTRQ